MTYKNHPCMQAFKSDPQRSDSRRLLLSDLSWGAVATRKRPTAATRIGLSTGKEEPQGERKEEEGGLGEKKVKTTRWRYRGLEFACLIRWVACQAAQVYVHPARDC